MKKRFTEEQIIGFLREAESGLAVAADFLNVEQFHATLLHECGHATGHAKRLARLSMDARFGSPEYAREELRVELASAMMTGLVGLPLSTTTVQSHASYIASWLEALRRDKGEIFRAAADAQRICDYLSERALLAVPRVPISPKQDEKKEVDGLAVERKVRLAAI